jgi:Transposase IS116/IS110/IS902 family
MAATKPACGPWLAAGTSCRPSSSSSIPNSSCWSPRSPRPWSPCPGLGSTPPGSCWSPPVTPSSAPRRGLLRAPVRPIPDPGVLGPHHRHQLNRGGDRQANNALWRIALVRMRCHPPTRAYVERRTKQGLSKLDIMGCLKRYIAREVYHHLTAHHPTLPPLARNRRHQRPSTRTRRSGTPACFAHVPCRRIAGRAGYRS